MKKIKYIGIFICLTSLFFSCKKTSEKESFEPITFTFYSADLREPEFFTDKIAREITKRTGVYLEFENLNSDQTEDIALMMANENYPDLIFAKGDLSKLIEAKAVIPLDEYIEKYGQNMKKLYGDQIVRLRNTLDDPHIYSIGTYEIKSKILELSGNMQIQNAVLREFGYPKLKTLEDYENILLAYKNKYPEINGHKTICFSILTDSWYWYLGLSNPGNYVIGYPDDGQWIVNQETMEAQYKFMHPEMYKFYKWLNRIYNKGLLDPESFTQNVDVWNSKLKSGYVLGTSYPFWAFEEIHTHLTQNGMENRTFAYLPITDSEQYKDPSLKDYGFSGGWGIAISADCKNPERAFRFLDWMCSEEAQILTNWGIEGEHYYYDHYGKRISYENIPEEDNVGHWTYPFPEAGGGFIDSTGNPLAKISREEIIKKYNQAEKETLNAYGVEMWPDLFPSAAELGVSKHGQVWQYPLNSKMTALVNQADDFVKDSLIKMIINSPENFDNSWKNMQQGLIDMGIESLDEYVTNLIKMKMELWK